MVISAQMAFGIFCFAKLSLSFPFFWVGDLLLQGINCMSSMMVGFTSHLKNNFEFFGLL